MSEVRSFKDSPYNESVHRVRQFMFDDIDKTLQLAHTTRAAPNFLLALGLSCYTEYWGKLLLGTEKKERREPSKIPFITFLKRLDCSYYEGLLKALDVYGDIRCGLAHAYMIDGNATIDVGNIGCHGIEYNSTEKKYTFWVRTYFEEFKKAVNCYINGLDEGTESLDNLEKALDDRPELL
jgi:hypothetical protein